MIKQSTFETIEVAGLNAALRALRLPHNGEPRSNVANRTSFCMDDEGYCIYTFNSNGVIDPKDIKLMQNLQQSGDQHAKVLRGIVAWVEIEAPIYWWIDLETYVVGHQRLCSASTMHTECKGLQGEELQEVKGNIPMSRMVKKVDYFSYQTLRRIAFQRHNHRLPEFHQMIEWMHTLPLAEELIFNGLSMENGDPQLPQSK